MSGPRLPKGSIPLPEGTVEMRDERFERLLDHYDAEAWVAGVGGTDPHGRFVVVAQHAAPVMGGELSREMARTSSLARCEVVGLDYMQRGWSVICAFDLDTLDGPKPPVEVGDEVLSDDGLKWQEVIDIGERHGRRTLIFERSSLRNSTTWMYEEETDEDGGIQRKDEDPRWPVKHEVAAVRTIIIFNTVPGVRS